MYCWTMTSLLAVFWRKSVIPSVMMIVGFITVVACECLVPSKPVRVHILWVVCNFAAINFHESHFVSLVKIEIIKYSSHLIFAKIYS